MEYRDKHVPTSFNHWTWVCNPIEPSSLAAKESNASLAELRSRLAQTPAGRKMVPADRLHMTEAMFKGPTHLRRVIRSCNPGVCDTQLKDGYHRLYEGLESLELGEVVVQGRRLEAYGRRNRDTLVLEVVKSPSIREYRQPIVEMIVHFLSLLGVRHPELLMAEIPWLKDILPPTFSPHISLGWEVRPSSVPRFDVYGMLVVLQPPQIYYPK